MFIIREGKYTIPGHGTVDTSQEISDERKLELYELGKTFPFITMTKKAVPFLKSQKLDVKRLAKLILNAQTVDEVNWLLSVKKSDKLKNIAATKLAALEEKK